MDGTASARPPRADDGTSLLPELFPYTVLSRGSFIDLEESSSEFYVLTLSDTTIS